VLLQQRPDVRAAAWAVAARSARIGVARADLFPAISLAGTVSYSADTVDATPDSATFVAGPGLRWDFLNYGRLENAVRIEDARLQQAIEAYRATVLRAAQEIDDAAARVARTRAQQRTLAEAVKASERALELANTLFAEGYVTFDRVLDAQLAVFAQSTTEVSARGEYLAAVVELHRALGGGWRVAGVEDLVPEATREEMEARTDWGGMLTEPAPAETTP
jgi:outer membrane protein TolC